MFSLENIDREVSTIRLGNAFSLSHQTVNNYLDCLQNSFLFVLLRRFTGKTLEKYRGRFTQLIPAFTLRLSAEKIWRGKWKTRF